ncbi:hypothetical protein EJ08DRAFT_616412 [Tothia fuscella]|uniref:Zn(2)-C6 fungal-type domain-containing protein n=1 Tax=Tothia fuscella TaxID=1048955 RepID=A0A9P4TVR8_9PEZI|nr:hypothetical protein EJ08DRAFT_616412 [Tothia fuscella]
MASPQDGSFPDGGGSSASPSAESSRTAKPARQQGAIAAQACETCRNRKSRCDEGKPRCGLCKRLNVECRYREPLPTKKDKSIQQMMQQLNRMESKLNMIGSAINPQNESLFGTPSDTSTTTAFAGVSASHSVGSPFQRSRAPSMVVSQTEQTDLNTLPQERSTSYQHLTAPHKIMLWPSITEYMRSCGIDIVKTTEDLKREGTAWFLRLELQKYSRSLPCDTSLHSMVIERRGSMESQERVTFSYLDRETILRLADAYFQTYNVLYPLLDRDDFEANVIMPIIENGFGLGDFESILVLLVCALGQTANEGIWGEAIEVRDGRPSGIRGGDAERPPGLDIFNEARRRMGFIITQTNLDNIIILQLTAIFYEACSRHLDFWRASVSASMAFQILVKCEPLSALDWESTRGYSVRTVYWTCNLIENWYHMDLDLPRTGIEELESQIKLPGKDTKDAQQEHIKLQFLAMIALRRVISRIHVQIFEVADSPESPENYSGPPMSLIKELSQQLERWRDLLPAVLQWKDESRTTYTPELRSPADSPVDLGNAHLRSRYYYAQFMVYRPLVYKALHFPDLMTEEDIRFTSYCLQACMLWPIAMDPPRMKKRLIPYLFAWSQNFLGVLLILRMTTENRMLGSIAERSIDPVEVEKTASLLLDWFRDMRQVDGMAEWAWEVLSSLYNVPL